MSANQVNSVMPVIKLYHTLSKVGSINCSNENCKRSVKAEFQPAMCHSHRDNVAPRVGWAYITKHERELLNIIRRRGWLVVALVDIRARDSDIAVDETADMLGEATLTTPEESLGTPDASDAEPDADTDDEFADMED